MALATRCPSCSTVFRISTAQAAAKGGMVRCGQCRNVFNSLDALVRVEDLEVIDEAVAEPPLPVGDGPPADAAATTEHPTASHDQPIDAIASPSDGDGSSEPAVVAWWLPEPGPIETPVEASTESVADPRDDAGQLLPDRRTDPPRSGTELESTNPTFMQPMVPPPPAHRLARWGLGVLVFLALLGLVGQAVYLWRDELAARWSPARSWLLAACQPLQCKVDYPMHLASITIESASVKTTGPNLNVYELTALLRNRDTIDLRYPYLELVLTDLQDRPILRRALRPEDYLPPPRDGRSLPSGFPAESELPIRILFELSDLRFSGFRVERFYP